MWVENVPQGVPHNVPQDVPQDDAQSDTHNTKMILKMILKEDNQNYKIKIKSNNCDNSGHWELIKSRNRCFIRSSL